MGNTFLKNKVEAARGALEEKVEQFKDQQMRQGDVMRSAQMAMQIAATRDQLQWGCGLYSLILLASAGITHKTKQFPKPMAIPLVLGGFALTYLYDFAYGTKMIRVRLEAEHILENERERLIPIKAAPMRKFWEKEASLVGPINRVGQTWPFGLLASSSATKKD